MATAIEHKKEEKRFDQQALYLTEYLYLCIKIPLYYDFGRSM